MNIIDYTDTANKDDLQAALKSCSMTSISILRLNLQESTSLSRLQLGLPAIDTRLMQYRFPLPSGKLCPRCVPASDTDSADGGACPTAGSENGAELTHSVAGTAGGGGGDGTASARTS